MLRTPLLLFYFFNIFFLNAQVSSRNGQALPAHGTFRVLVVFAEVVYPDGKDPYEPTSGGEWQQKQLPKWHNDLFDAFPLESPHGMVSRFFHEASFGDFDVCGDVLVNPLHPEQPFQYASTGRIDVSQLLNAAVENGFTTKNNLPPDSFDLWAKVGGGMPKKARDVTQPLSYDHIMIIVRNSSYPANLAGYASAGNISAKGPVRTDSYSLFSTHGAFPLHILLHEFNHLILGGNNVHCCGGNHSASGSQYFMSFQGGWGMMGAANKSLMTCNAWDRYKLGWKPEEKTQLISSIDRSGKEINSDFDFSNNANIDTLIVLRDFVTSGDAIRIRLPGIPDNEYQQWLWIENHQTSEFNNSLFDQFQYESSGCTDFAKPGLYAYIQIEHNDTSGKNTFGGLADFIRVLPASGFYDMQWGDTMVQNNWCQNNKYYYPFIRHPSKENPLSGNGITEIVSCDNNSDGHIAESEKRELAIELIEGNYYNNLPYLGEAEMAFSKSGNASIGIGTNPSSANCLTLANDDRLINQGKAPDNRTIYLNNISVEIVEDYDSIPGSLLIRLRSNNPNIENHVRWCAPRIVLPDINHSPENPELVLSPRRRLVVDFGETPVWPDSMYSIQGEVMFSAPTIFELMPGSVMLLKKKSRLILKNHSVLKIHKGAIIVMERGSKLLAKEGAVIINEGEIIKR